jgi:hypothetical protein
MTLNRLCKQQDKLNNYKSHASNNQKKAAME